MGAPPALPEVLRRLSAAMSAHSVRISPGSMTTTLMPNGPPGYRMPPPGSKPGKPRALDHVRRLTGAPVRHMSVDIATR